MPDDLAEGAFAKGSSLATCWRVGQDASSLPGRSQRCASTYGAADAQAALQEARQFMGTDVAERRILIMVNPAPGNDARDRRRSSNPTECKQGSVDTVVRIVDCIGQCQAAYGTKSDLAKDD